MGVLVALAVVQLAHELCGRVADDEGHGLGEHGERVFARPPVGHIQRVRFRRQRQVHHRLGQVHGAFGHADPMAGLVGGDGDL